MKKCLQNANGIPIGRSHDKTMAETRVYKVESLDGHKESLSVNNIDEIISSQVEEEDHRFVLFGEIVDNRIDGKENMQQDAFIVSKNGGKIRTETTKDWKIMIKRKDISTIWNIMKDLRQCHPLKLAGYFH